MKNIFIILLTFFCLNASGQILNIEKFRLEKDTFNVLVGNISAGFSTKKQQTNIMQFYGGANAAYLSKNNSYMLLSKIDFQKVKELKVVSEGYVHLRENFFRKKILSLEHFSQMQYDFGRGLQERYITGLAGRLRIKNEDKLSLSFNTGFMYENELWNTEETTLLNESIKSTTNLTIKAKITKSISFFSTSYYQAKPQSFLKPRIITDSSLQLKITDRFAFMASYIATYDAAPIIDIAEFIYEYKNSLVYTF